MNSLELQVQAGNAAHWIVEKPKQVVLSRAQQLQLTTGVDETTLNDRSGHRGEIHGKHALFCELLPPDAPIHKNSVNPNLYLWHLGQ